MTYEIIKHGGRIHIVMCFLVVPSSFVQCTKARVGDGMEQKQEGIENK